MTTDRDHDLTRLRLAAALTHQLAPVALTLWVDGGSPVVAARDDRAHPDLSACALRAAVLEQHPWLLGVGDLTVDGVGVRHVGDGVVAVEQGDAQGRWWPTVLAEGAIAATVADAAAGALEDGLVDADLVGAAEVAAHVDRALGVTVVQLRTPPGTVVHDRRCDLLARALARACVVTELLEAAGSRSRT